LRIKKGVSAVKWNVEKLFLTAELEPLDMSEKINWESDILEKAVSAAISSKMKYIMEGNEHLFDLSLRKCMIPDNYKTIKKKEK
jgi:hypothetical protein